MPNICQFKRPLHLWCCIYLFGRSYHLKRGKSSQSMSRNHCSNLKTRILCCRPHQRRFGYHRLSTGKERMWYKTLICSELILKSHTSLKCIKGSIHLGKYTQRSLSIYRLCPKFKTGYHISQSNIGLPLH